LGLGVIAYGPTGGGLLTGKYGRQRRPEHGRIVERKMYATRYASDELYEIAERFAELAGELGHAPTTLAIAWVPSRLAVTTVLVGARDTEQLAPALAAASLELDDATRARISALSPEPPPATDRNEEKSAHNYGAR